MQAIIISIGDELTLGQILDTNAVWLSAQLAEQGVTIGARLTVPDERAAIVQAFQQAAAAAELVISSGGLGPTADDLTRQALADLLGAPLELDAAALAQIESFLAASARSPAPANHIQAQRPHGAECLSNPCGTAPGLKARLGQTWLIALPGVPLEMQAMFSKHVVPLLKKPAAPAMLTATLRTFGLGEARLAAELGALMARDRNPKLGLTVAAGVVSICVRSQSPDLALAQAALDDTLAEIRRRLGTCVYGTGQTTLAEAVGQLLSERGRTLVTAESCTAGLLGSLLTEMPGASAYYLGGWVVYANALKSSLLGVPEALLEREGAVSQAVALRLASGALERSRADYALALTGIAGPQGGTAAKPRGTVWIALASRQAGAIQTTAQHCLFPGARGLVRQRAAQTALNMLRLHLLAGP